MKLKTVLVSLFCLVLIGACSSVSVSHRKPAGEGEVSIAPSWKDQMACLRLVAPLTGEQMRWPWGLNGELVRSAKEVWNVMVKVHYKNDSAPVFLFTDQKESLNSDEQKILELLHSTKFNMVSRPLDPGAENRITPEMEAFVRDTLRKSQPTLMFDHVSTIFVSVPIRNYVYGKDEIQIFQLPDVKMEPGMSYKVKKGDWNGYVAINDVNGNIQNAWDANHVPSGAGKSFSKPIVMTPIKTGEIPNAENELFIEFDEEMGGLYRAAQAADASGKSLGIYQDAVQSSACTAQPAMAKVIKNYNEDVIRLSKL